MAEAAAVTTITIDIWQLLIAIATVVVFIGGLMMVSGKLLLKQIDARLTERDQNMTKLTDKVDEVERDVLRLRGDLPNEYVRREDWIRFTSLIDTKLDWLREKQDDTRQVVTQFSERLKSFIGASNDR